MIEEFDPRDASPLFEDEYTTVPVQRRAVLSPQEAFVRTAKIFAPAGVGLILIWFGLNLTGSYFSPATRFGGSIAGIVYGWQVGTLMAMVGTIAVYDAIKRSGYL